MLSRLLQLIFVISLWPTATMAMPELCLQSPKRTTACPNLLYKKSKQAIPTLGVQANDIVCLCLTDIKPLLQTTPSALEKIDQQVAWVTLTEQYQLTKEQILALIRD